MAGEGLRSAYVPAQASPLAMGADKVKRTPMRLAAASPLNSSPLCSKIVTGKIFGWKRSASDSKLRPALPSLTDAAPRRLFSYQGPLPVPVTERLEYIQRGVSVDAGDELSTADSSFTSDLDDPFNAWFNANTMTPNPGAGSSIDLAAKLNFSDSPVIHASEMEDTDNILASASVNTESWQRQPSGVGLGISVNANSSKTRDDAVINDLFFQFTQNGASGEWSLEEFMNELNEESDVEGELMYPPNSQCEMEDDDDRISTDDESSVNPYNTPHTMSPPLKRRRTVM